MINTEKSFVGEVELDYFACPAQDGAIQTGWLFHRFSPVWVSEYIETPCLSCVKHRQLNDLMDMVMYNFIVQLYFFLTVGSAVVEVSVCDETPSRHKSSFEGTIFSQELADCAIETLLNQPQVLAPSSISSQAAAVQR